MANLSAMGTKTGTKNVGLIQSSISVNLLASVAFREVTGAERFRRDFGSSRNLLDSDPTSASHSQSFSRLRPTATERFNQINRCRQTRALQLNSAALTVQCLGFRRRHVEISHESGFIT